jgi:hypothetical protein
MEMRGQSMKKRSRRSPSIFILIVVILSGITINPLNLLTIQKNASGSTMTIFYEDFDSGTGALPWTGSSGTWTDRTNYPSGYGTSLWQVVADPTAPSSPNCLYSGPEQQGGFDNPWFYGTCTNAETPTIDLRNASSATLTFMHRYNFPGTPLTGTDGGTAVGFGDGGMVFISIDNGVMWDYIEPEEKYPGYVGGQPTWVSIGGFIYGGINPYEPFGDHDELLDLGGGGPYQLLLATQGGGAYVDDSGGWQPATFDLSDYIGNEVIISFRYTHGGT